MTHKKASKLSAPFGRPTARCRHAKPAGGRRRALAVVILLAFTLQMVSPDAVEWLFDQLSLLARAETVAPEPPACADDSGVNAAYAWYNPNDGRYLDATTVGTKDNPYVIKNGAELMGLANVVNDTVNVGASDEDKPAGPVPNSFGGQYITFRNPDKIIDIVNFSGLFYINDARGDGTQLVTTFVNSYGAGNKDYFGWKPIGADAAHAFRGTFFSEGYEVRNLACNVSTYTGTSLLSDAAGLFGYVDFSGGGYLSGFHLTDVQIGVTNQKVSAGALVGRLTPNPNQASIVDCSVEGKKADAPLANFTVAALDHAASELGASQTKPGGANVTGGLIGTIETFTPESETFSVLENCLVGYGPDGQAADAAVVDALAGAAGGLVGASDVFSASGCRFDGAVTAQTPSLDNLGGIVSLAATSARLSGCAVNATLRVGSPQATAAAVGGLVGRTKTAAIEGGSFTGQLYTASYGNSIANITLAGTGGIVGTVSEKATISDCRVGAEGAEARIEETPGAKTGIGHIGGVLGNATGSLTQGAGEGAASNTIIDNCTVYIVIDTNQEKSNSSTCSFIGGIAGCISLPFIYTADGKTVVKKMVDRADDSRTTNQSVVRDCTVKGRILGRNLTGGVAGLSYANIVGCSFEGTITGSLNINADSAPTGNGVGGIVGEFTGDTLSYSWAKAAITVKPMDRTTGVGGIAGRVMHGSAGTPAAISNNLFNGTIAVDDIFSGNASPGDFGAGGVIGLMKYATVTECATSANITMTSVKGAIDLGGIVGRMVNGVPTVSAVSRCLSAGSIHVVNQNKVENNVGGLVGKVEGVSGVAVMKDCLSSMTISSTDMEDIAGGLMGRRNGGNKMINSSMFTGTMLATWGGSIVGDCNYTQPGEDAEQTTVYFDRTLSPNGYASYPATRADIGEYSGAYKKETWYARTTEQLTDGSLPDAAFLNTVWTVESGRYPRLSWMLTAPSDSHVGAGRIAELWAGFGALADIGSKPVVTFSEGNDHALCVTGAVTPPSFDGAAVSWTALDGVTPMAFPTSLAIGGASNLLLHIEKDGWSVKRAIRLLGAPAFAAGKNGLHAWSNKVETSNAFVLNTEADIEALSAYIGLGGGFLGGWFLLGRDIDLRGVSRSPMGTASLPFSGHLDGRGHTLSGFAMADMPGAGEGADAYVTGYGGFFGYVGAGIIQDVTLDQPRVSTKYKGVGILVGYGKGMQIWRSAVTDGTLTVNTYDNSGLYYRGGLVGAMYRTSTVKYCSFTGRIENANFTGGLVGNVISNSTIESCYVAGDIGQTGFDFDHFRNNVGGLAGALTVGGLAGTPTINNSFAMGNVVGKDNVGGLVGNATLSNKASSINSSYFYGNVNGNDNVGGLVGNGLGPASSSKTTIKNAWFAGQVTHSGLAGAVSGTDAVVENVYVNKELSGPMTAFGAVASGERDAAVAKTTAEMTGGALFFGDKTLTPAAGGYPYRADFYGSSWGGGAAMWSAAKLTASASTQSLYDFGGGDNNAYIVKQPFTVTRPTVADPAYTVAVTPSDNVESAGFTIQTAGNVTTYGFGAPASDLYLFTADYGFLFPGFAIATKVVVVPFAEGDGTQASPFGIPDVATLKAFRDYVNRGLSSSGAYYKLTMPDEVGDVYDLSKEDWIPIGGVLPDKVVTANRYESASSFGGRFDGNGKIIRSLRIGSAASPAVYNDRGSMTAGLFGSVKGGSIDNLTVDDAQITVSFNTQNFTAGILTGQLHSSTVNTVQITGASLHVIDTFAAPASGQGKLAISGMAVGGLAGELGTSATVADVLSDVDIVYEETGGVPGATSVGGLAGRVSSTDDFTVTFERCVVRADIAGASSSLVGGLAGEFEAGNYSFVAGKDPLTPSSSYIAVDNCATYGNYEGFAEGGGAVGRASGMGITIKNFVSAADLYTTSASARLGGVYGTANQVWLEKVIYAGRLGVAHKDDQTYIGGLAGYVYFTADQIRASHCADAYYDRTLNSFLYKGREDYAGLTEANVNGLGYWATNGFVNENFYQNLKNSNVNPILYELQTGSLRARATEALEGSVSGTDSGAVTLDGFTYASGLYPIPGFVAASGGAAMRAAATAGSVVVRYVWSGAAANQAEDGTREEYPTSVYVTYGDGSLRVEGTTSAPLVLTRGDKRAAATAPAGADAASAVVRVMAVGTKGKRLFIRPDSTAAGKTDISFLAANPEGDGIGVDEVTAGTYTLYNADQLQGLALLVPMQMGVKLDTYLTDGHGNRYFLQAGGDAASRLSFGGRTVYLGADIDAGAFAAWEPIGADMWPFQGSFDGRHHTVSGLRLTQPVNAQGMFGYVEPDPSILGDDGKALRPFLRNVGILQTVVTDGEADAVGALVGYARETAISGCFSDARVASTKQTGTFGDIYVGGLVGCLSGGSLETCFVTGSAAAAAASSGAYAGGLAGSLENSYIAQCYAAGFTDGPAGGYGAFAGKADGASAASGSYIDTGACGQIAAAGGGSLAADRLTTAALTANGTGKPPALLNFEEANWTFGAGLYPLLAGFDGAACRVAVIPVTLESHARSTTAGRVAYAGASLTMPDPAVQQQQYTLAADGRSFVKKGSSIAYVRLVYGEMSRDVYMDLKCWYDDAVIEDGKTVYTIGNAYELQEFAYLVSGSIDAIGHGHSHVDPTVADSFQQAIVRLSADIDMTGVEDMIPAGTAEHPFRGTFDGQGYLIANLQLSGKALDGSPLAAVGLFGVTDGATIRRVGLASGAIAGTDGASAVGGLIGRAVDTAVEASFNGAAITVSGGAAAVGGVAGKTEGTGSVTGCFNMAVITVQGGAGSTAGGVTGSNAGTVTGCYNTGMLTAAGETVLGGVSGRNTGGVTGCYNAALLDAAAVKAPIAPDGTITGCVYDRQVYEKAATDVIGAAADVSAGELIAGVSLGGSWSLDGDGRHYPQCAAIRSGTVGQAAASSVGSVVSRLNKAAGNATYKDFESMAIAAVETFGGTDYYIQVTKKTDSQGGSFDIQDSGGLHLLTPADAGPTTLTVSMRKDGILCQREMYFIVVQMLSVRYGYDFSGLTAEPRAVVPVTGDTWLTAGKGTAGDPYLVSTPADLRAFSAAVANKELAEDVAVALAGNIDMTGQALAPIGTAAAPFTGTFDGRGHVISHLTMSGGTVGLFGAVGTSGQVRRVGLENAAMTLTAASGDQTGGMLAAVNDGSIQYSYVRGDFTVGTPGSLNAKTRAGALVGINNGRIAGCYFRPNAGSALNALAVHSNIHKKMAGNTWFGILVGLNAGTMSGCYHTTNVELPRDTITPRGIAGYSAESGVSNCFYDTLGGWSSYTYAFDTGEGLVSSISYEKTTDQMKSPETSLRLSFDLYLMTYEPSSEDGYPVLEAFSLIQKSFPAFGSDSTLLFNLQNNLKGDEENYTVMNAAGSYEEYLFPLFGKIPVGGSLLVNLPDLPKGMTYTVTATAYGRGDGGAELTQTLPVNGKTVDARTMPQKAFQINLIIALSGGASSDPWGVHQKWSSTEGV